MFIFTFATTRPLWIYEYISCAILLRDKKADTHGDRCEQYHLDARDSVKIIATAKSVCIHSIKQPHCWRIKQPLAPVASGGFRRWCCPSVCLSACTRLKRVHKMRFSHKLSNTEPWSLFTTNRKSNMASQRTHSWTFKIQDGGWQLSWKSLNRHISTKNHPLLVKCVQKSRCATRWQSPGQISKKN